MQTFCNLFNKSLKMQNNDLFFYSFLSAFEEVIATAGCFDEMIMQRLWNTADYHAHILNFWPAHLK